MKVESLIFDMDGTLWDSAENVARSWTEVLKEKSDVDMVVTESDIKAVMGMPMDAIARKMFGEFPEERPVAIMRMTILGSMEENSMMALRIHWQSYQKRTGFI